MRLAILSAAMLCLTAASAPGAIIVGQVDDFETLTTQNWQRGSNIANGGPDGAGDAFLRLSADGIGNTGKLVTFNGSQWSGDYSTAGVTAISAWVNNTGATNLKLRAVLGTSNAPAFGGTWYASQSSIDVSSGSGWTQVLFPLGSSNLTKVLGSASYNTVMGSVTTLRILHSASPSARGDFVVATLGVDNIKAFALGDVNDDGNMDNLDITPFVQALVGADEAAFLVLNPNGNYWAADTNTDGNVDNLDVTPFVNLLVGGGEVPEPATLALLLLGACLPLRRRHR